MWRAFPEVQSDIFNLNGLAHKIVFEAELRVHQRQPQPVRHFPQCNEIDDNAQERFRERLVQNTFGGVLPPPFDPRFYALRTGAGLSVTAPYNELIDDQQFVRLGIHQRLQTKVGPPDRQRIRDWMTLDLSASLLPQSAIATTSACLGTADGPLRLEHQPADDSLLANALYDYFPGAEQLWNVGVMSQRSERGSVYLGLAPGQRQTLACSTAISSRPATAIR